MRLANDTKGLIQEAISLLDNPSLYCYVGAYESQYTTAVYSMFQYSQYPQVTFNSRTVTLDAATSGYAGPANDKPKCLVHSKRWLQIYYPHCALGYKLDQDNGGGTAHDAVVDADTFPQGVQLPQTTPSPSSLKVSTSILINRVPPSSFK